MVNVSSPATALPRGRILLSAFGVHTGGGLVLLDALAGEISESLKEALLDNRVGSDIRKSLHGTNLTYVRRSFLARVVGLWKLASLASPGDVLFCFNNLPPFRKPKCRVINYVHAPHFVGAHQGIQYAPLTSVRMAIERCWFRLGIRNCDEIWVQTPTMANALQAIYPSAVVKVMPFVDDTLYADLQKTRSAAVSKPADYSALNFFYPADAVGHKNHVNLFKAWRVLAEAGKFPTLRVTLSANEFGRLMALAEVEPGSLKFIENLGHLSRKSVFEQYGKCSAMLFASTAETFGLPMIEASALGVPIIAAERDFVRDVCSPIQTFDPASPHSICQAIERYASGDIAYERTYLSAAQLVEHLLA
jgi:glycosyltransferase involved in cell wall biosynthesis